MLVSQLSDVRRFMGRLDSGQDISAGIRKILMENRVSSGWLHSASVLRDALVRPVNADGKGFGDPITVDGIGFCPTASGNVSLVGDAIDIRIYGVLWPVNPSGGVPVMGIILGGSVINCEFYLTAIDDMTLVRDGSDDGFSPWVQIQAETESARSLQVPVSMGGPVSRPAPLPIHQAPDEDEMSELNAIEMVPGDYVDHPRFGVCRVLNPPSDDKISIRLPTGKNVDLSLGVMRVLAPKQVSGRRIFQIEMKRRG